MGDDEQTAAEFVAYITDLPVTLGRASAKQPASFVHLSSSVIVSKLHATLDFDAAQARFVLTVLGRMGCR